jgi:hypothetical protein|eukprot:COSAG01_NODE_2910_length_6877_cov_3.042785_2_plen_57_part_00
MPHMGRLLEEKDALYPYMASILPMVPALQHGEVLRGLLEPATCERAVSILESVHTD